MKNISMLIKPSSSACNLQCSYCFYHSVSNKRKEYNKGFMSEKIMQDVIERVFECNPDSVTFTFQGGEPTVIGIDFYKKFVASVKLRNTEKINVQYSIQTNGVLIDVAWCELFKENNFLVGISLDGLAPIHNKYRFGNNGGFEKTGYVIEMLKDFKIPFTVLTVVTPEIAENIEKVYNLYKEKEYKNLHFMPCIQDFDEFNDREICLSNEQYKSFLIKLFDLWYEDYLKFNFIHIRFFDNVVKMLNCYQPMMCGLQGKCSIQYVIEADGSVYPCDYYCTDEYMLGNISEMGLSDIFETSVAKKFISDSIEASEKCKDCEMYPLCKGGCRRYRQASLTGEIGESRFCDAYRCFFDHVLSKFSS